MQLDVVNYHMIVNLEFRKWAWCHEGRAVVDSGAGTNQSAIGCHKIRRLDGKSIHPVFVGLPF